MADSRHSGGFVSLVGAGPGDPGLLTRKGAERLAQADVVLHDELVSRAVLTLIRDGAEVVHRSEVGDGQQAAINDFLVRQARRGRRVVRLKGGDPFVFGRGAEEAEALALGRVAWEVVPGVSAGTAVPAYAGIPVTHRSYASDVTFVTGHEEGGKAESAIQWERIVRTGGTLVVFMGVRKLPEIILRLVQAGGDLHTPCAVIEWGTTPMQRTVVGDLSDIVDRVDRLNIDHPSLVVIGKVVALRDKLAWFDRRPLWGRRVLVTRSPDQAGTLVEALRDVGAGVIQLPVLEFAPPTDAAPLQSALADLGVFDWILFTSANAVDAFAKALDATGRDLRAFGRARVAAVGPATAEALQKRGIRPDVVPPEFRAEGLLEALPKNMRGQRFLLPRAEVGRDTLPDALRASGGIVDVVPVYRTVRPQMSAESARHHIELADTITFTSPSSLKNLMAMVGEDTRDLLAERRLAAIGPISAKALQEVGLQAAIVARVSTAAGLVEAVVEDALSRA